MRGTLIQKFLVDLRRLDPAATDAVPGGGYNDLLNEPIMVDDGTQLGASSRRELPQLLLQCQLNRDPRMGIDIMTRGGHQEDTKLEIVLFMEDLENEGHLTADGKANIHPGDRVASILDINGNMVIQYEEPQAMYIKNSGPAGYGLDAFGTPKVNLWVLTCMPDIEGETL